MMEERRKGEERRHIPRTWLDKGRLFLSGGSVQLETGERYWIVAGELHLANGYLILTEPDDQLPPHDVENRRINRRCRDRLEPDEQELS